MADALYESGGQRALVVNRLTKSFGDRIAFSDVSFEVAYGEVFGFLGLNGAGKATTVGTLGTLIAPTSGSATVAGIPLSAENGVEIRQRISIMPETPGLYLRLTVTETSSTLPACTDCTRRGAGSKRPSRPSTSPIAQEIFAVDSPKASASG
jgi:ABC-2 type transport system ATP-binding protein